MTVQIEFSNLLISSGVSLTFSQSEDLLVLIIISDDKKPVFLIGYFSGGLLKDIGHCLITTRHFLRSSVITETFTFYYLSK